MGQSRSATFAVALCKLLLSLVAASVIGWYQETLSAAIALAVFLPVISGMGGNSGNQVLAVSIRELSLGLVQPQGPIWVVLKEATVGLTNGLVLGLTVAILCFAWQQSIRLSAVVGVAIALNTVVAACRAELFRCFSTLAARPRVGPDLSWPRSMTYAGSCSHLLLPICSCRTRRHSSEGGLPVRQSSTAATRRVAPGLLCKRQHKRTFIH